MRARARRAGVRQARLFLSILAGAGILAACGTDRSPGSATPGPNPTPSATASATPAGSGGPGPTAVASPAPSPDPSASATAGIPSSSPATSAGECSASDRNREFFRLAAASMSWPVYCAVLPAGWFVETGAYHLADGGRLDITYRGPGDAHLSLAEGNVCAGVDIDACAPRDAVTGPATFGDRDGELGRLANGLVLDVDRGAAISWRATGLGLPEATFRELCAAFLRVAG